MTFTQTLAPILALARAGMATAAWDMFRAEGVIQAEGSADVLTLKGRLLKDIAALETGAERISLLGDAAAAYAAAAQLAPATYPLINAATLAFLSGDPEQAAARAEETLRLLYSDAHEPDTAYWLGATRAEALLLLNRIDEAKAALQDAIAGTPLAWEDHAVTLRQFHLILATQDRPADWLDALRAPPALHYAGPIAVSPHDATLEAAIDAVAGALAPGTATGALAAGFDIVSAERLLGAGARLQIILPAPIDIFVEKSVRPAGADWQARFERLLADCASLETLDLAGGLSPAAARLAEEIGLGSTICEARLRDADAIMLRLDGAATDGEPPERAGLRKISVSYGAALVAQGAPLEGPEQPIAMLGCRHADAQRLAALTGASVTMMRAGAVALCPDLARAAEAAVLLFDPAAEANVVLDYGVPNAGDEADMLALDALLSMPASRFPIATRTAALALATRDLPFRTALAGAGVGLGDAIDYFSLCQRKSG